MRVLPAAAPRTNQYRTLRVEFDGIVNQLAEQVPEENRVAMNDGFVRKENEANSMFFGQRLVNRGELSKYRVC